MHTEKSNTTPFPWVDPDVFPFRARFFDSGEGRMHYVDEGAGAPVVLVHGTPTWSFLYRHLIAGLARTHRVIAIDHLGFGLSDKPMDGQYRPLDHARRLARLLDSLALGPVTLVVHGAGGPIGLSYAIERPEQVGAIVMFNTWMWSLEHDLHVQRTSRLAGSALGSVLYRHLNLSPKRYLPMAFGDRRRLSPEVHRHYVQAFPSPMERTAPWVLAREMAESAEWFDSLWYRRSALATKPTLLLWGMKDPTFGADTLARWSEALPGAELEEFAEAGHFVQEEVGELLVPRIKSFLARCRYRPGRYVPSRLAS